MEYRSIVDSNQLFRKELYSSTFSLHGKRVLASKLTFIREGCDVENDSPNNEAEILKDGLHF